MPRREQPLASGNYYHVYNRGLAKEPIFFEPENFDFFIRRLRDILTPDVVTMVSYCLMPNHYHTLVQLHTDAFSTFMQRLHMSFANAMNKRYQRVGPLFQGRFQARHVEKDSYLLHLSRYIHLNPVHAGLVTKAEEWEHSSYRDFIGLRRSTFVEPEIVISQLSATVASRKACEQAYRVFVEKGGEVDRSIQALIFEETAIEAPEP